MEIVKVESAEVPQDVQVSRGKKLVNFGVVEKTRDNDGEVSSYYEYCQVEVPMEYSEDKVLGTRYAAEVQLWKEQRQDAVDAILVTYNGKEYQGDETSQGRMSRAINGLPDDNTTVVWVALDNSENLLTKVDLQVVLANAGMQQAMLWNQGRPVKPEGIE
jgi:hypothetical protein